MKKELSEMTLAELWDLFPIQLTEPQPCWRCWYEEERRRLLDALPGDHRDRVARISHVGSTAIRGIWAKPIVDILIELKKDAADACRNESGAGYSGGPGEWGQFCRLIESAGYLPMSAGGPRASFNRGYTPNGFADRVFHLHLRLHGDNDELYFRDYLNDHPDAAAEYEKLKLSLWRQFEHDRDTYTEKKSGFVALYTKKAREQYGKRYDISLSGGR